MKPAPPVIRNRKNPPANGRNESYTRPKNDESSELLNIVFAFVIAMPAPRTVRRRSSSKRRFGIVFVVAVRMLVGGILRAIAIGIRIVAIRIVVVGCARIDGVEHDAEQPALYAHQKIARAREGFLGCLAAADDHQHTVSL